MSDDSKLLDAVEAAKLLQGEFGFGTAKSLAKHRHYSTGPKYLKLGRFVRYTPQLLREWAQGQLSPRTFAGTAEYRNAA